MGACSLPRRACVQVLCIEFNFFRIKFKSRTWDSQGGKTNVCMFILIYILVQPCFFLFGLANDKKCKARDDGPKSHEAVQTTRRREWKPTCAARNHTINSYPYSRVKMLVKKVSHRLNFE
jgi:hypothetical protein